MRSLQWDDYDLFCRVVEQGGFSAAARELDRPKSSISAAVMRLEDLLQTRLLERTTRRLRLTESGEALYQGVGPLFASLRGLHEETIAQRGAVVGTLRIASPYEFGAHHVAPVATSMMRDYPKLRVTLDVEHTWVNPQEQRYDIAFAMLHAELPASTLVAKRAFSLPRDVFASPELLAQHPPVGSPADLAQLPLLAGAGDTEWPFQDAQGRVERVPVAAPRLSSSNADVRLQAALAGLGVARITSTFCTAALRQGRLQRLLPEHRCEPLHVYALLPATRLMPQKVRVFLDRLSEHASHAPRFVPAHEREPRA
jgi:DNA-binding transcriptional LysR family regulator